MVDQIDLYVPDGGRWGLGFIHDSKIVNPRMVFSGRTFIEIRSGLVPWLRGVYFLMATIKRAGAGGRSHAETMAVNHPHEWTYPRSKKSSRLTGM